MLVSAMDRFVHEFARHGMLQSFTGARARTDAFQKFSVSLTGVLTGFADPTRQDWLSNEIMARHGWLAFQYPDRIADAVRLVSNVRLWERVGKLTGQNAKDVKRQVSLIVQRRNKIAHEADTNPSYPGTRWPIDEKMVDDSIAFIETVCEHIFTLVR